jgi:hypothetical protein
VLVAGGLAAGAAVAGDLLPAGTARAAAAADAVTLAGDGFSLSATGGTVTVLDSAGTARLLLGGYRIGDDYPTGGTPTLGTASDGTAAILITYTVGSDTVNATYTPRGRSLEVVFDIQASDHTTMTTGTLRRSLPSGTTATESYSAVTEWVTDSRGGVPYEQSVTTLYEEAFDDGTSVYLALHGSNTGWSDANDLNLPGTLVSDGVFTATAYITLSTLDSPRPSSIAGRALGSTVTADAWTTQPYHIWTSATTATVHGSAYTKSGTATLAWTAYDFDGTVVASRTQQIAADAQTIVTDDFPVPLSTRGIVFVQLQVTSGTATAQSRVNLAMLPSHTFSDTAATSTFGIAADFLLDTDSERALLKRIGVRWSRNPQFTTDELTTYGFKQNRLRTPGSLDEYDNDPDGQAAYISSEISTATTEQAQYYELANEWNLTGGVLTGTGGADYVTKWAVPFSQALADAGSDIKLMSVSLGGMDYVYANNMFDAGLADCIDAFGLHPGRGNFTPDYAPDPSTWDSSSNGSYWNFLGAVREANSVLADNTPAGKTIELWLTEVYACTQPNNYWHDSYRHAAENVFLSHVLAVTEGVRNVQWFQFYDGVKSNPQGTDHTNPEYHYGLVMRDHSPKPSLLAYAAAAEVLDGATFRGWMTFDGDDIQGVAFDTPKGSMAVLWSRADGYILNADHGSEDFYPMKEPWVDPWKTRNTITMPATGSTVTCVDCVGRSTTITASGSSVQLTLDGAPRAYYGLDLSDNPPA